MPFSLLHHQNSLSTRQRRRKEKQDVLPRLNTSTTTTSVRDRVTAIELANASAGDMESNRISRIFAGAARMGKRASIILPGTLRVKATVGEEEEGGVEVKPSTTPTPEVASQSPVAASAPSEASSTISSRPASKSGSASSRPVSASTSDSISSLYSSPTSLNTTTTTTNSRPASCELPQTCVYDPKSDEYIPESLFKNPFSGSNNSTSVQPQHHQQSPHSAPRLPPLLHITSASQTPIFELDSIISPITAELHNLAIISLERDEERKQQFQKKREMQRRDMHVQFQLLEAGNKALRDEIMDEGYVDSGTSSSSSIYSQSSGFISNHKKEASHEDEEEPKHLDHRDSGISMGDDTQAATKEVERLAIAEEYWRLIHDSLNNEDDSFHGDANHDDLARTKDDSTEDDEKSNRKPPLPSRSRARRCTPRARWEVACGGRSLNNDPGDWRHILWLAPGLRKKMDEREGEFEVERDGDGITESETRVKGRKSLQISASYPLRMLLGDLTINKGLKVGFRDAGVAV